jgi:hypothetical protein
LTIVVLLSPFIASIPVAALKQIVRIRKDEEEKKEKREREGKTDATHVRLDLSTTRKK